MTTYKSLQWLLHGLFFSCFLLGGRLHAQDKVLDVKLGFMPNTLIYRHPFFAVESRLGERLTWQLEFGGGRSRHPVYTNYVSSRLHIGFSMRSYLFLRQGLHFCGFYVEPFLSHDRIQFSDKSIEGNRDLRYASTGGLGFGFQQVLFKNWTLDAGLRLGGHPDLYHERWNAKHDLEYRWSSDFGLTGYLHFAVGHAF